MHRTVELKGWPREHTVTGAGGTKCPLFVLLWLVQATTELKGRTNSQTGHGGCYYFAIPMSTLEGLDLHR